MKLAKRRKIGRRISPNIDKNKARALLKYKKITTTAASGKRVVEIVERLVLFLNKGDKRQFLKQIQDRGLYRELRGFEFPKNGGSISKRRVESRRGDNAEMISLVLSCKVLDKKKDTKSRKKSGEDKTAKTSTNTKNTETSGKTTV